LSHGKFNAGTNCQFQGKVDEMIVNGQCKTNVVSSMMVDEDITVAQQYLGEDMECWDYIEEQYKGGGHLHTIIMHTSTAVWSMHKHQINFNSSPLDTLE
jgi:hypothetical protein